MILDPKLALRALGLILCCKLLPLEVARNGYYYIKSVEECLERNALDDVEIAADSVNDDPEEPLFDVFLCQCPKSDEAKCVGEGIKDRDGAVGVVGKDVISYCPSEREEGESWDVSAERHTGDAGG